MADRLFLDAFRPDDLAVLERLWELRRCGPGETLFDEGTPADGAYVLLKGELEISGEQPGGGRSLLAVLSAGSLTGERALLTSGRRSATATARGPCEAAFIDRRDFQALCARRDPVAFRLHGHLVATVARRIRRTHGLVRARLEQEDEPALGVAAPFGAAHEQGAPFDVRPFLPLLSFFKPLGPREIDEVLARGTLWTLPRGRLLFDAGTPSDSVLLVIRGAVEVRTDAEGGKRVGVFGPGATVGELGVLLDRPRSAAARAREELVLLGISADVFRGWLAQPSRLGFRLLAALSERLLERMAAANRTLARIEQQNQVGASTMAAGGDGACAPVGGVAPV